MQKARNVVSDGPMTADATALARTLTAINMWSSENGGTLDLNAEIELWTRAGQIKIAVGKHIDVRRLDLLIANAVLRSS